MVHRDPETGQFMTHDDEPVELTYSDHEFVNFQLEQDDNKTGGGEYGTEYQVESDVLDLENDELAELTWIDMDLTVSTGNFSFTEETKGGAYVSAELGANLADNEYLGLTNNPDGLEQTDSEGGIATQAAVANDDPGIWSAVTAAISTPFKDEDSAGDGFSGGGAGESNRQRRVFRQETSGGPYIDATDDITLGIATRKDAADARLLILVTVQMSFLVYEYENRRQEFAPYDPGPSM